MQLKQISHRVLQALTSWPRPVAYAGALALTSFLPTLSATPAAAQGLFAPAITVNEDVITRYELEQRELFLTVLGETQGNAAEAAREALIEDRLKRAAINQAGLTLSDEEITEGMRELAGRTNMSLEEFLSRLNQSGVSTETVRDFAAIGLGWREYAQGRFLAQAQPSDAEIDRAMGSAGTGSVQVLLSEVILPYDQNNAAQVEELATQIADVKTAAAFAASAAQFSASSSRTDSGRLPWLPLSQLPAPLQNVVLEMQPGEITEPLPLQGAIAIFQMRGLREVDGRSARYAALDYATYRIPGGRSPEALAEAKLLRDKIDTCDDLYGVNKGKDPALLFRGSKAPGDIPQDISLELAKMDANESSANVTRDNGQTLLFVMLCGRTSEVVGAQEDARQTVANALLQQRLAALAESYVEQLKANARISYK
ncbi:peptidylprolyl isomerase [Phaeobacter sp. HF9A]|uniref:peptidylprolyl isomerase n=1 Tax=Phaeobacter sp. HF9A TaxID=2721561 RepID=UPI0014322811|nr:peptidylprolyl isomerase [Phaeobacter sp. HF9A]NIZ12403.1 peptidylprolyl isomerase [Phaeobacter sp. HF9A]